jgi:type IV pilus assembly protein PilP
MRNKTKLLLIGILVVSIAGIYSCGEKAPPVVQPNTVKKKIADQKSKPAEKPETSREKAASPKPKKSPIAVAQPPGKDESKSKPDDPKAVSDLIKESMAVAGTYDPNDRFDPFEPLFKDEPEAPISTQNSKRKKRMPQTPLERVALSQLKLSAIMRTSKGNSAIVEDATGKGYVIKKGTYIGLNSGRVIQIDRDGIVVEEEIEDLMGEFKIKNTELKLQKPAGEL